MDTSWSNTVSVKLTKRRNGGLGIMVKARDQGHGLLVADLAPGGEAEKTGLMRAGDRILNVNGKDVDGLPYDECLRTLQELQPDTGVTFLVRVLDGYTTKLLQSADENGVVRVIRVTQPINRSPRTRRSNKMVDSAVQTASESRSGADHHKFENYIGRLLGEGCRQKTSSPERPYSLTVSNQGSRKNSISSPSRRPLRLRNIISGHESVDTLVLKATEPVLCSPTKCLGSLMSGVSRRPIGTSRPKEEVLRHAKQFFDQYYSSIKRFNSPSHDRRWKEVVSEVESAGTYELKETELVYGAKLAWRNAPRCIGRIQWSKLQVFDARYVTTAKEMFHALCNHIKYGTNKGNIRSAITIFPQRTDGLHDFRVWNSQLIMYAGYTKEDGSIHGDPANLTFTELCLKLGWKSKGSKWDVLPLVLSANGHDPQMFELPEDLILRVPITHPNYSWFEDLDLQWYALPAVSSMLFDVGGIEFPAAPFNGWYMVTEIGSRDLCDTHRFNILEEVASKMGVNTKAPSTLWKDRVVIEVNFAVLHSFQKANVTIVDHHTASESFMKHWESELRVRGGCPADWVWIVPPLSSSLTPVFHQEMLYYNLKPSYEYQDPPWKTHIWERDRDFTNGPRTPSKKLRFKEVARAVKFTSNLFGKALSRRIKATILYATETGKSEQYARTLEQTFSHAFNASVICMTEYDIINLEHETLLLVVTSTFGNGDPPENGESFARNLQAIKVTGETTPDIEYISVGSCMPFVRMNSMAVFEPVEDAVSSPTSAATLDAVSGPLSNVRFAVFALGSSAYPNFCSFGRYVDTLLAQLGGERLIKMGAGDELCGQEYSFRQWAQEVFQVACDVFCVGDDVSLKDVKAALHSDDAWNPEKVRLVEVKKATDVSVGLARGTNRKIAPCVLRKRTVLHSEEDSRQTLLVEMSTGGNPDMMYFPGDHVGIYPSNRKELVDSILERLHQTCPEPDRIYRLEQRKDVRSLEGMMHKWVPHEKIPTCSLRVALTKYFDITTPPGQQFLRKLTTQATDEGDKRKIKLLATDSNRYEDWKSYQQPNLLEVLEDFPSLMPSAEFLLFHLPALQPRFYSISSSPDLHPGLIHLTVAVVVYRTLTGALHYGVCSNYLQSAQLESEIFSFVRSAPNFRLPARSNEPVIMVGPGTGIAPFRSFWQQRLIDIQDDTHCEYGPMTLLIGCRRPTVELYKEETTMMKEKNVLTNVHKAFSRVTSQPKRYVQDILRDIAPTVYRQLVEERGHIYVCGDVSMAEDVNKTLKILVQEQGNLDAVAAENLVISFQEENRYHEDIFGITLKTAEVTSRGRDEARSKRSTSSS